MVKIVGGVKVDLCGVEKQVRKKLRRLPGRNKLYYDPSVNLYVIERDSWRWRAYECFFTVEELLDWLEVTAGYYNGRSRDGNA